ncbi:thioredoxin isoform X3 [Nematostella vectensis]|uniref:thioredoxin isoform X3 n=1 Tax=Nematostella vectensis TaxID=45351 RepID=UPI001390504B|nr:thioredoxin isoform X3 [Nematostella vectensis]
MFGRNKNAGNKVKEIEERKMALEEFKDVFFAKIDVDELEELSEDEQITAMPTFVFYKNGQKLEKLVGANEVKLRELILKYK